MPSVREAISDQAHESWSGWMAYMFSKSIKNSDGSVTLPVDLVLRWERQMLTPYSNLTEKEKDSDREQADKYLEILDGAMR